ncbi:hypothetical protein HK405_015658, partial [Cladochytrium tenue]
MDGRHAVPAVDAIDYLSAQLNILERRIYALRASPDSDRRPDWAAFLSFATAGEAHRALRALRRAARRGVSLAAEHEYSLPGGGGGSTAVAALGAKPCPAPVDMVWSNVGMSPAERAARRAAALAGTAGITLAWTAFAAAAGALSDLRTLVGGDGSARAWLADHPGAQVIWVGFVIPGAVSLANVALPHALRGLTLAVQGTRSRQGVERSVLRKLYSLFLYQLFVVSLVGSLLASRGDGGGNGSSDSGAAGRNGSTTTVFLDGDFLSDRRLTLAIAGLASKSNLYINYLSACLAGYGLELIQGVPLIQQYLRR